MKTNDAGRGSRLMTWAGWGLTALFALFMAFNTAGKLMRLAGAGGETDLGFPSRIGFAIGVVEALLLALYLFPRTSVLGAVLFTGLFGGAMASHVRAGDPLLFPTLMGVYLGVIAWGGIWLRDPRLRAIFPFRR